MTDIKDVQSSGEKLLRETELRLLPDSCRKNLSVNFAFIWFSRL
jgi:hypothetical protein